MNLHVTFQTVPHPEDLQKGAQVVQSCYVVTPETLAETLSDFVATCNKHDLWAERGSMVLMIQPILTGPKQ